MGVTKILCSFRWVQEGQTGKETCSIKIRVIRNVFSKQLCFIWCTRQAVEWRRYSRFTFVKNTISNLPKVPTVKFLGSDRLFYFISICKFGRFQNPLSTLLTCLNFTLDSEVFSVGTNEKRDFYNYGSSTNYWKPWRWMRINLILAMSDIYINYNLNPLTKFTSSSWNISHMITKTVPISKKIVVSYTMKGAYRLEFWWKVDGNWDKNMIRISQWRESHCRTTTSVRRER